MQDVFSPNRVTTIGVLTVRVKTACLMGCLFSIPTKNHPYMELQQCSVQLFGSFARSIECPPMLELC